MPDEAPVMGPGSPGLATQTGLSPTYEAASYQASERALAGFDPHQVGSGNGTAPTPVPQGEQRPNFSGTAPVAAPPAPNTAPTTPPATDPNAPWKDVPWLQSKQAAPPQAQPGQPADPAATTAAVDPNTPAAPLPAPTGMVAVTIPGAGEVYVTPERAAEIQQAVALVQTNVAAQAQEALQSEWTGFQSAEQEYFRTAAQQFSALLSPAAIDKAVKDDLLDESLAQPLKDAYNIAAEVIRDAYERNPLLVYQVAELRHAKADLEKQLAGARTTTTTQTIASLEMEMGARFPGSDLVSVKREGERAIAEGRDPATVKTLMEQEAQRTAGRGANFAKAAHQTATLATARAAQLPPSVPPSGNAMPPTGSRIPDPNSREFATYLQATQRAIGSSRQGT